MVSSLMVNGSKTKKRTEWGIRTRQQKMQRAGTTKIKWEWHKHNVNKLVFWLLLCLKRIKILVEIVEI